MRQRQNWRHALALLLAVVLASVATASPSAGPDMASVRHEAPAHHDDTLATYHSDAATLARFPVRVLDARGFGVIAVAAPPPDAVRPLRLALDSRSGHGDPTPRTRRAPSTGDRAPPSH